MREFNEKVIESLNCFRGYMPECVAIAILMAARKECKIEEANAELLSLLCVNSEQQRLLIH
jgi:hypothetical protein